jgi:hypothetical protein
MSEHQTKVDEMAEKLLDTARKYAYAIEGCFDQIRSTKYKDPQILQRELDTILAKLIIEFQKAGYEPDFEALQYRYAEIKQGEEKNE